jgi:hypothetical protein
MNPAYFQARFRADLPHGGLPHTFCIVTACNPDGKTATPEANAAANTSMRDLIEKQGWPHFPVTGGSADFSHAEPGFGIIAELEDGIALARTFRQEALFFVQRGRVFLYEATSHAGGPCWGLKSWAEMTEGTAAQPAFHFSGPPNLLDLPATAFFCSTECPGDAVLKAYAWAQRQCDEEAAVISGFHTPVEKDILAILARSGARILWVPARDLPIVLDETLRQPEEEGRLTILSPFDYKKPSRPTQESASQRNQFILRLTQDRYLAHAAPGSSLAKDLDQLL